MYVNKIWKGVLNHAEVDLLSNGCQRAGSALGADIGEPGLGQERKEGNFPRIIAPGTNAEYRVYSPSGTSTGIEFYLTFRDKVPAGEHSYGTVQVSMDMPYWKHANTSSCYTTGTLGQNGFTQVPHGAYDFSTSFVVYNLPGKE